MPQSRGAPGNSPGSTGDAPSGDALYNQGMAHYRRHEWRKARQVFLRLKAMDPNRRGVDALLDELDIFIRFDSSGLVPPAAPAGPQPNSRAAGRTGLAWRALAGLGSAALVAGLAFVIYGLLVPRAARRAQELSDLAQTHIDARNWPAAIDAYEEYLLLVPSDDEARSGLWAVYYERGHQRSAEASALEEEGEFTRASERWEGALADFRAAQQVHPDHSPDPRGETSACIDQAGHGRRLARLVGMALDLSQQQRWTEAIQALEAARSQDPDYHKAEVAGHLCDALLARGHAALTRAETNAQVRWAVQILEQAVNARPESAQAQVALRRAQGYLQATEDAERQAWDAAIHALEPLLAEEPGYAGGRAQELLCLARWQRAGEFGEAGRLREALADYQAVAAASCPRQDEAGRRVTEITLALTPTPRPTSRPTPTLAATPAPTAAP